jgi:hypothetical protein
MINGEKIKTELKTIVINESKLYATTKEELHSKTKILARPVG